MKKLQVIKIALLIVILAEEIKKASSTITNHSTVTIKSYEHDFTNGLNIQD